MSLQWQSTATAAALLLLQQWRPPLFLTKGPKISSDIVNLHNAFPIDDGSNRPPPQFSEPNPTTIQLDC